MHVSCVFCTPYTYSYVRVSCTEYMWISIHLLRARKRHMFCERARIHGRRFEHQPNESSTQKYSSSIEKALIHNQCCCTSAEQREGPWFFCDVLLLPTDLHCCCPTHLAMGARNPPKNALAEPTPPARAMANAAFDAVFMILPFLSVAPFLLALILWYVSRITKSCLSPPTNQSPCQCYATGR